MIFLPDTNVCSRFLRGQDRALVARWIEAAPSIRLSTIVLAELEYGAAKLAHRSDTHPVAKVRQEQRVESLINLLPAESFNPSDAKAFGRLRAQLEHDGEVIGPYDLLIAAQALRLGATVVTHNLREFQRVPGLKCENWQQA